MRIDLGMSLVGDNSKPSYFMHIHRSDVVKRIKKHPSIDPWTKEFLLKRLNQYPDNALGYFVQNINQIVIAAINERSRVKEGENNVAAKEEAGVGESFVPEVGGSGSRERVEETQEEAPSDWKKYDPAG